MEIDSPLTNGSPTPTGNAASAAVASAAATAAPAASKMAQLTESLKLEHHFLRVPFEHYKKSIRANHRVVEKEVSAVVSGVCDVADSAEASPDQAVDRLTSLVSRLQGLKRKVWLFLFLLFFLFIIDGIWSLPLWFSFHFMIGLIFSCWLRFQGDGYAIHG